MSNTKEISFRIGEQSRGIVTRIVDQAEKYDSVKEFYETSVRSNVRTLQTLGTGGEQARTLILLLDRIRGIDVTIPEDPSRTFILEGELSTSPARIELSPSELEALSKLQLETGLGKSELIRRCIFRQLSQLAQQYNVIQHWRSDEVQKTWEEVKAGLQRPKRQCYEVLYGRFVEEHENTLRRIEADPAGFERFANEYTHEFYESDVYNQLRESRDEQPFINAEKAIEEYTDLNCPGTTSSESILSPGNVADIPSSSVETDGGERR